jgi:SAM-dependent methyltransferase
MSHPAQMAFFADLIDRYTEPFSGRILDVGAADLNGGPRAILSCDLYVGIDLAPQANVDVVANGGDLPFQSGQFDVVMSSECFEHDPNWEATLTEMIRTARPSGLVAFSAAATGRGEHGTTRSDGGRGSPATVARGQEWYGNLTARSVRRVARRQGLRHHMIHVDRSISDIYFVASKAPSTRAGARKLRQFRKVLKARSQPNRFPGPFRRRLVLRVFGDAGFERVLVAKAKFRGWGRSMVGRQQ